MNRYKRYSHCLSFIHLFKSYSICWFVEVCLYIHSSFLSFIYIWAVIHINIFTLCICEHTHTQTHTPICVCDVEVLGFMCMHKYLFVPSFEKLYHFITYSMQSNQFIDVMDKKFTNFAIWMSNESFLHRTIYKGRRLLFARTTNSRDSISKARLFSITNCWQSTWLTGESNKEIIIVSGKCKCLLIVNWYLLNGGSGVDKVGKCEYMV